MTSSTSPEPGAEPGAGSAAEPGAVLDPAVRRVIEGPSIAHVATVAPDGAPHSVPVFVGTVGERIAFFTGPDSAKARHLRRDPRVALSVAPADDPMRPVVVRGRVVEWLDGDAGWAVVDRIFDQYVGGAYPRGQERVVLLVEPEVQRIGVG